VKKGDLAHRFRAAGDDGASLVELKELGGAGDRFHAGGTIALDGVGNAVLGNAGGQGDDTGDVGGIRRRSDVAENDLVDLVGAQASAAQDLGGHDTAEFLGRDVK